MRKIVRNIFFIITICCCHTAIAQSGFYVPVTGKIFFKGDSATIFSNVINQGSFGVGKSAFVNFSGQKWENSSQSVIADESNGGTGTTGTGGWIRFLNDTIRQQIKGGYNTVTRSGPTFPRLQIQNNSGVELVENNTKIRRQVKLSKGLFYLHDYILSVGDRDPGTINGYDSSRYFVTDGKSRTGLLLRENITSADGQVVFPVGSGSNSYTPAAIQNTSSQGDDYYVNVFDGVKSNVVSGSDVSINGVNKTWEIGKRYFPGIDKSQISLQHINTDEGSLFTANRNNAYVSYYNGSRWDTGAPQSSPVAGYLTSGSMLTNSGVNDRIIYDAVSAPSYFTKFTGTGSSSVQTGLWFNARRTGKQTVHVYWKTKPEVNVQYFIVQRRLSNETDFTNVDTIVSQINGGISLAELSYAMDDLNSYTGISFYRLQVMNLNTTFFYSNIIAVPGSTDDGLNLLWPNPTQGIFYVSCDPVWEIEYIFIYDAIGRKVKQEATNGRNIIQMSGLEPGTYLVSFVRKGGQIVETKKLVVGGY